MFASKVQFDGSGVGGVGVGGVGVGSGGVGPWGAGVGGAGATHCFKLPELVMWPSDHRMHELPQCKSTWSFVSSQTSVPLANFRCQMVPLRVA